ncbi:anthranilate synthase component I [Kamptonema cortianum]|nr:anthranilate synthase component I [Geitlerinema splendidum]MDK3158336.1 anthranilate synthase component I [Kamptonema cortianum]
MSSISLTKEAFLKAAKPGFRIPVVSTLLADIETPLSAYWKVAHSEPNSFLLESVTGGEQVARYSIIGVRPRCVLTTKNGAAHLTTAGEKEQVEVGDDPLAILRELLPRVEENFAQALPRLCGGAIGFVGYDYVRTIERLPDANPDTLGIPDVLMMICDSVLVFDHAKNQIQVVALAEGTADGYAFALEEIGRIQSLLAEPLPSLPGGEFNSHPVEANLTQSDFEKIVARCVDYIRAGDVFQVVPSIRFETRVDAHPVTVYRALRSLNPSPFMFLIRSPGLDIVGASPELLVSLEKRNAGVRPIAGTRPRGATPAEDNALAADLLADEKERAEHLMLIDLGRNDLGRVCQPGTVQVEDLMVIEKYSHVMHIVSDVVGQLKPELDGIDLVRATFPAGTLSGAPKIRAMEVIDEMEPCRRGLYGGAVGSFAANGDVDLAIAIRTIVIRNGIGYVQAGAGIVADSNPTNEYQECVNKAKAALRAIQIAQRGI